MSTDYRLDLYDSAGQKYAEVSDFLSLAYSRRVNQPGLLSFTLKADHAAIANLADKVLVIVYRRNVAMGLTTWTEDFSGLYRATAYDYDESEVFTAQCPGLLTLLAWRHVPYYSGVANRSTFSAVPAETIMKTLVNYNASGSATVANGRARTPNGLGITTAFDAAGGNTLSTSCAWRNLLATLQSLAPIAGGDFDLVRTGAGTYEFRFYSGQRGTDRTASVVFALGLGNMASPHYSDDHVDEKTVAIVAGQGEGTGRALEIRTSSAYAAANDIETFVDARDLTTAAALQARGDQALYEARAKQSLTFKVLQTPASYYGVHYGLGDLVTARYRGVEVTQKVVAANMALAQDGAEQIDVETETQ